MAVVEYWESLLTKNIMWSRGRDNNLRSENLSTKKREKNKCEKLIIISFPGAEI